MAWKRQQILIQEKEKRDERKRAREVGADSGRFGGVERDERERAREERAIGQRW